MPMLVWLPPAEQRGVGPFRFAGLLSLLKRYFVVAGVPAPPSPPPPRHPTAIGSAVLHLVLIVVVVGFVICFVGVLSCMGCIMCGRRSKQHTHGTAYVAAPQVRGPERMLLLLSGFLLQVCCCCAAVVQWTAGGWMMRFGVGFCRP